MHIEIKFFRIFWCILPTTCWFDLTLVSVSDKNANSIHFTFTRVCHDVMNWFPSTNSSLNFIFFNITTIFSQIIHITDDAPSAFCQFSLIREKLCFVEGF